MYQLADLSARAPKELKKESTKEETAALLKELNSLQNLLYAEGRHSLLVVLQGPDASGKDGVIRNVFGALNPQGVRVQSFKVPTEEEAAHDFLWRIHRHTPERGMMQIFNRSHYEDVLVTRVHGLIDEPTAQRRFAAINQFEQLLLQHNGTQVLKFYLHISAEEQAGRLEERMQNPEKMWKYNAGDQKEAARRNDYLKAYEDVFTHCSQVPWVIVPADQNWYKEHLIAKTVYDTLKGLNMQYPQIKTAAL